MPIRLIRYSRAGIPVRAWNRTRDKAAPLAAGGVYLADSPADAARGAGILAAGHRVAAGYPPSGSRNFPAPAHNPGHGGQRRPDMSYYATEWRESGACLTADPDLFFPVAAGAVGARQADEARRICARCRVRRECLEFAMDMGEAHGIWGGTTPDERRRTRRKQLAAQRAAARRSSRVAPGTAA